MGKRDSDWLFKSKTELYSKKRFIKTHERNNVDEKRKQYFKNNHSHKSAIFQN